MKGNYMFKKILLTGLLFLGWGGLVLAQPISSSGWSKGNNSLFTSSSGVNVGIGTNQPTAKLEVAGAGKFGGTDERTSFTNVFLDGNDNGTAGVLRVGGVGLTNNEALDFNFESLANTVTITSPTGVNTVNFSGLSLVSTSAGYNSKVPVNGTVQSGILYKDFYYDDSMVDDEELLTEPFPNKVQVLTEGGEGIFTGPTLTDVYLPSEWSVNGLDNDGAGGDLVEKSSTQVHSGSYSIHLSANALAEGIKKNISTINGHWYRISFWYYPTAGTVNTVLQRNGGDYFYYVSDTPANTPNTWNYYRRDFYKENDANGTTLYILQGAGPLDVYLDDIDVEDLGTSTSIPSGFGRCTMSGPLGVEGANFNFGMTQTVIEDGEDAWNEQVISNVTASVDTSIYQAGSGSAKFAVADAFTTGLIGSEAISSMNFRPYDLMSLWIRSDVALAQGDYAFTLDNSANCASPFDASSRIIPAISANTWTQVFLDIRDYNTTGLEVVISIGLTDKVDKGAHTIWIDDVRGWKYGTVSLAGNSTNVTATDTDANLNIFDRADTSGARVSPIIKNRLGETKEMRCELTYN